MGETYEKSCGQSVEELENWCPICKTEKTERALTDTCGHDFCLDCLKQWSAEHNSCPVCRQTYHKMIVSNGEDSAVVEIPVPQPYPQLFRAINQMIRELEELFHQRLIKLKDSITSVKQSLQTLKALVTQMEAFWERNNRLTDEQNLVFRADPILESVGQRVVTELVSDSYEQNRETNENIPMKKKRKTGSPSSDESVEDNWMISSLVKSSDKEIKI